MGVLSRARAGAEGYPDGENRGEMGVLAGAAAAPDGGGRGKVWCLAGAAADGSEDMVSLTKKNVEDEESDRIETVTAAIMARARARYGVEGKPTERMGWRAMRKTRSASAVNLCETSE